MGIPTIRTDRLLLRVFVPEDVSALHRLASDRSIASTTLSIPYPYEENMARDWIESLPEKHAAGELVNFAITHRRESYLIGAVGLKLRMEHKRGELGYWIGKPHWKQGYGTEAAQAVIRFGFQELNLHKIYARTFKRNEASERVLQKAGLKYEGYLREHILKWDQFEDIVEYAILRSEFIEQYG